MPPRDLPFGPDTLTIPCYLSTGPDDPGLAAWKREHPDWFDAGTWTPTPQPSKSPGEHLTQEASLRGAVADRAAPDGMMTTEPDRRPPTAASALGMGATRPTRREPGRERGSADWADDALRAATFRIGAPSVESPDVVGPTIEKAAATKPQSLPLIDDQGQPVITPSGPHQGQSMQFPAGFDPHLFVARGLAARKRLEDLGRSTDDGGGDLAALALEAQELLRFRQNRPWDAQRVDGVVQQEWVDYASVAIGLFSAASGLASKEILMLQDKYAAGNSDFGNAEKDGTYTHLARRNVENTLLGYALYDLGRITAAPGK